MHETYVSLLCAHAPSEVRAYLEAHSGWRLDACLQATQAYGCDEATALLLERTGDVHGAMRLTLASLRHALDEFATRLLEGSGVGDGGDWSAGPLGASAEAGGAARASAATASAVLLRAADLCERGSSSYRGDAERLWFGVLDELMDWQLAARHRAAAAGGSQQAASRAAAEARVLGEHLAVTLVRRMADTAESATSTAAALRHLFERHEASLCDMRSLLIETLATSRAELSTLHSARGGSREDVYLLQRRRHIAACLGKSVEKQQPPTGSPPPRGGSTRLPDSAARAKALDEAQRLQGEELRHAWFKGKVAGSVAGHTNGSGGSAATSGDEPGRWAPSGARVAALAGTARAALGLGLGSSSSGAAARPTATGSLPGGLPPPELVAELPRLPAAFYT